MEECVHVEGNTVAQVDAIADDSRCTTDQVGAIDDNSRCTADQYDIGDDPGYTPDQVGASSDAGCTPDQVGAISNELGCTPDKVCDIADRIFEEGIQDEEVLELYAEWADNYDQDLIHTDYKGWENTAQAVAAALGQRREARILDMACGTGQVGKALMSLGFHNVDGLDPNPKMLSHAKQKGVYKNIHQCHLGRGKVDAIPDNFYDAACVNAAIGSGHLNSRCFDEMTRIVQPGGFIVLQIYEMRLVNAEVRDVPEAIESRCQAGIWEVTERSTKFAHKEYGSEDRIGDYITLKVLEKKL